MSAQQQELFAEIRGESVSEARTAAGITLNLADVEPSQTQPEVSWWQVMSLCVSLLFICTHFYVGMYV